ncbi:hypothetical protein R3P38DRAFT_3155511 [Favolaschia claudopus]|uniref:Uncharacterized protein n=1 Tax=Favolaschia claudopus TaxID=2862362 RepID=A0AAV9YYZ7_9AGAR
MFCCIPLLTRALPCWIVGVANLNVRALGLSPTLTSLLWCCLAGFRMASIGVFGYMQSSIGVFGACIVYAVSVLSEVDMGKPCQDTRAV